jgi:hypothetical protein
MVEKKKEARLPLLMRVVLLSPKKVKMYDLSTTISPKPKPILSGIKVNNLYKTALSIKNIRIKNENRTVYKRV